MHFIKSLILLILIFPPDNCWAQRQFGKTPTYFFKGGWIFDGSKFEKRDFYSTSGCITFAKQPAPDSTIEIDNKYVIPPFGEAHNHNLTGDTHDAFAKEYMAQGIFYVKNPNSLPRGRPVGGRTKMIGTVDGVFSNGGLTGSGGHPSGLTKRNIGLGIFKENEGDGGFIWIIDNDKDLDSKWDIIVAGRPDFIKTYLLYSEEFERRKIDTSYFNRKGIDPEILKEIVKRAHQAGLRVSTHIETAVDFRNALNAKVDEITHMPGFRNLDKVPLSKFKIDVKDARLAFKQNVFVVTTLADEGDTNEMRKLHSENLVMLKNAKVKIALGSDKYRGTSKIEADYINSLGVFSNLELLKIWCENTVATIYPGRKVGKLQEGYEANFLVLESNPIDNFKNTEKIYLRIKQGLMAK